MAKTTKTPPDRWENLVADARQLGMPRERFMELVGYRVAARGLKGTVSDWNDLGRQLVDELRTAAWTKKP
jgi:hypothetical protein